jgi:hypothetical protein
VIGWRFAGRLFVLIPPVRTLAHFNDVTGPRVFAGQQLQVREFNLQLLEIHALFGAFLAGVVMPKNP